MILNPNKGKWDFPLQSLKNLTNQTILFNNHRKNFKLHIAVSNHQCIGKRVN